ncbi:lysylphosphatidylglycerol synthase transmembrane domain-containing protein [Pseudomonas massiliensis]|uniref:lysylphosphatidylglycerol synthase transmembrane domain-containing protein n=1 Tax=Pseudomonas massiliensis TaxID=522492 RepID=UPI00058E0D39|nr:lysylphosphatidylglycerol synthase transmembrane domain-containing protein [Pseudomonas massiliensis]
MKRLIWLALALAAGVALPWALGGAGLLSELRGFPLPLLLGLFAMILLCWTLNAIRLRVLLQAQGKALSLPRTIGMVMATEFAICATPGGSGGPLTLVALLDRQGIPAARSGAVFAMDQLSDLLFFCMAIAGVLLYAVFHQLNSRMEWLLGSSAILMVATLLACWTMARHQRRFVQFSGFVLKRLRMSRPRRWRWARRWLGFVHAFKDTAGMPRTSLALAFLLTCAHWALRFSVLWLALHGLGADLQWAWSFLVQILSLSAGQFSLLPGGAGAAELTSAALLTPLVGKPTAAAAILIWRIVTFYFYLLAGAPVFVLMVGKPLLRRLMALRQA